MGLIDNIKEKAKQNLRTIVLPESEDERVLKATEIVLKDKTAKIILIGNEETIKADALINMLMNWLNLEKVKIFQEMKLKN